MKLVVFLYLYLFISIVCVVRDVGCRRRRTTTTEADGEDDTTTTTEKVDHKRKDSKSDDTSSTTTTTEDDDKTSGSGDETTEATTKSDTSKSDEDGDSTTIDTTITTTKPFVKNETIEKMAKDIESGKFSMSDTISKGFSKIKSMITGAVPEGLKNAAFYKNYNKFVQSMYSKIFQVADYKEKSENSKEGKKGVQTNQTKPHKQSDQQSNFWVTVPLLKNILGKTCFDDIGCFAAMEYQDFTRRPIPLLPMAPEFIQTTFHIFTPDNTLKPENFSYNATEKVLKKSSFNPSLKTAIIVHGFRSAFEPWMVEIKDFIFKQSSDYNVIVVVWEKGAMVPLYHLAATNTRVVGALIAFFITTLNKAFNTKNDQFWLIGHSLGGQTVGYAGKRLNDPQVFRITGLDPAGPGFHFENATMHLDKSDASFVDVWHTDNAESFQEGMGSHTKRGVYDFFPNGGLMQPGCKTSRGIAHIIHSISSGEELSCSHTRGNIFPLSLGNNNTECMPIAYECLNYETFIEGRCTQCTDFKCQPMGLQFDFYNNHFTADPKTVNYKYWIQTAVKPEFCVFHYQFGLHIHEESDPSAGVMEVTVKCKVNGTEKSLLFERYITGTQIGEIHSFLITFEFKIVDFQSLTLFWQPFTKPIDNWRTNYGKKMKINHIEINYMSHMDAKVREENSYVLCVKEGSAGNLIIRSTRIEYEVCKTRPELDHVAKGAPLDLLVPLSASADIHYIDYEKTNAVIEKLDKSNLANKTFTNFFAG